MMCGDRSMGLWIIVLVAVLAVLMIATVKRNSSEGFVADGSHPRLVVTMTATPQRLLKMTDTIDSILNQTVKPDIIYINIPHVLKRTGETYDISQLKHKDHALVKVIRSEDFGPVTKLLPALAEEKALHSAPDTMILVMDDDHIYPPNYIEIARSVAAKYPEAAIALSCTDIYTRPKPERTATGQPQCDIAEAFAGVLYRIKFFGNDEFFTSYLASALTSNACFRSDDFVISNYLELRHVPRIKLVSDALGMHNVIALDYGLQGDALHQSDASMAVRYHQCNMHLQSQGYMDGLDTAVH